MFLDESVRELSRQLENKVEKPVTNEAETLKLQQRSQQAALLSKQLQVHLINKEFAVIFCNKI